jgi:multidrug efflux pump
MKKSFTDIFINRPVMATVISLLIFLVGAFSATKLQVREFPDMTNTVITVTTAYPGASAQVIQGFVTTPLQQSIASAEGIDYMTSTSVQGSSVIKAFIRLNFDPQKAMLSVMSKVNEVTSQLPTSAQQPVIEKSTGASVALMYLAFRSKNMDNQQINDYLSREVQPELETLPGVAQAQIMGGNKFAMRVWLNPEKLASYHVTAAQVISAIQANNYQTAAGATKGKYVTYDVDINTDAHDLTAFKNMVVKNTNGALLRLKDIAKIELGSESYDTFVNFDNENAVFMAISTTPDANPLTVAKEIRDAFPQITSKFPPNFSGRIVYDGSTYISNSIKEVARTIIEATIIVVIVIFLFLGSLRTVLIPMVTIPLSMVGVCALLLALNYSINLMTLLAMVLAIGLVVDDAIVVVENVYRHLEEGMTPIKAALQGAREIATPIIAMTITLAAVYAPIAFMGGITGSLFREFAFTLAMTVILSGVIALTLSPMMTSKVLNQKTMHNRLVVKIDKIFEGLKGFYQRRLSNALNYRPVTLVFMVIVILSSIFMAMTSRTELAPTEDQGFVLSIANGPSYANIDYVQKYSNELNKIYQQFPSIEHYFVIGGFPSTNGSFSATVMKPWNERSMTQTELQQALQVKESGIAGLQAMPIPLPSIPSSDAGGLPFQFVITTTSDYPQLYQVSEKMLEAAQKSGLFIFIQNDLSFDKPNLEIHVDRNKAAALGVSMQDIGSALSGMLGGNFVSRFSMAGQSYKVIPQLPDDLRFNPQQLNNINVQTANGNMIPLTNLVTMKLASAPSQLNQFQQLNSATLGGMVMPGHTTAEAVQFLQQQAAQTLPAGYSYSYAGQTRQEREEGDTMLLTFFFSLIVIFLVLAAQFESFRDPWIILVSVPMSLCGALIFINLGLSTLNIYSGIGLVTLIGLISKHGILMVDFANKLQMEKQLSVREAIIEAAAVRLRPILMTTLAMVFGMVPLLMAAGPGAVSRFDIGVVIAAGMLIGTCFTLFVLPTVYTFLAHNHSQANNEVA